jgi:hypothetical protein
MKRKRNGHLMFDIGFKKQTKLNYGAKRHHYSMFNVGRSMLDVHPFKGSEVRGSFFNSILK